VHRFAESSARITDHNGFEPAIGRFSSRRCDAHVTRYSRYNHTVDFLMTEALFETRRSERAGRNLVEHHLSRHWLQRLVNLPPWIANGRPDAFPQRRQPQFIKGSEPRGAIPVRPLPRFQRR
jgi:hypothetical protein